MSSYFKSRFKPLWTGCLLIWIIVLLLTPTVYYVSEGDYFTLMIRLGVVAMLVCVIVALAGKWSRREIAGTAVLVMGFCLFAEILGSRTGFPFGHYHYSEAFSIHVLGVPLLIPLAWLMMIVPAWGVTSLLLPSRAKGRTLIDRLAFAGLAGLVMTAWDLLVDPQMVAFGFWEWADPSGYFGIPWTNFAGWWLTSFFTTLLVNPRNLPRFQLLILYSLTLAFEVVGLGLIFGHPYQALVGGAVMGGFALVGWSRYLMEARSSQVSRGTLPEQTSE